MPDKDATPLTTILYTKEEKGSEEQAKADLEVEDPTPEQALASLQPPSSSLPAPKSPSERPTGESEATE